MWIYGENGWRQRKPWNLKAKVPRLDSVRGTLPNQAAGLEIRIVMSLYYGQGADVRTGLLVPLRKLIERDVVFPTMIRTEISLAYIGQFCSGKNPTSSLMKF